jgi:hypothetical protein
MTAPDLPARARRVDATDVRPTLLEAVAACLRAHKVAPVVVTGGQWLHAEDELCAHVKGGRLIVDAVRDGIDHGHYHAKPQPHTPTGHRDQAADIAAEIISRLAMRRVERARFAAWKAARHAA